MVEILANLSQADWAALVAGILPVLALAWGFRLLLVIVLNR